MQQIVDCDTSDDGCDGGDPPTAYQYVISAGGLESYADYPYTAQDGQCAFDASEIARSISSWEYVTQSENNNKCNNSPIPTDLPQSVSMLQTGTATMVVFILPPTVALSSITVSKSLVGPFSLA